MNGLVVDLFAGGGGASLGMEKALGRSPDVALNHDPVALAVHAANHPKTVHLVASVWEVKPLEVTRGRRVSVLWASPDCRHFSRAKGDVPRSSQIRSLAWAAARWARDVRPSVIFLENVEEFLTWGPLDRTTGKPLRARRGQTFRAFVKRLESLGYEVEWRLLDASHYGAPTRRRRLFLIARCDGMPISWPEPTHGKGLQPLRTAASCIDWALPCPSIFERERPLAEKTLWRVAEGIKRFVLNNPNPFIIRTDHHQSHATNAFPADQPLGTITSANGHAVVDPFVVKVNHGKQEARGESLGEPLSTVTAQRRGHALVTPFVAEPGQRHGRGQKSAGEPLSTVVAKGRHAVVAPTLIEMNHRNAPHGVDEPLGVVTTQHNRFQVVAPTLVQTGYGERPGQRARALDIQQPLGTCVDGQKHALVSAFCVKHFGGVVGTDCRAPLGTVKGRDSQGLAAVALAKFRGSEAQGHSGCCDVNEPLPTISAQGNHVAEVRAFLTAFYGSDTTGGQQLDLPLRTQTTKDRLGLVTVSGAEYQIVDIGLRMLQPHELLRAQFGKYAHEYDLSAARTKEAKVRLIGNSVCPEVAEAIVRANLPQEARAVA